MRLVAKIFNHAKNIALPMTTGMPLVILFILKAKTKKPPLGGFY
jgi:hypothetical protein